MMRAVTVSVSENLKNQETLFTLPKPLAHLQCHLFNIALAGNAGGGGGAHIDLRSVLQTFLSDCIPCASNTARRMRFIEKKKLQIIHLVLLTLVHHLCPPFCFHCLGPDLHPRLHSFLMNLRSAKHIPIVAGSGNLKNESTASPKVTRVGSRDLTTVMIIQQALTRLQQITTIMMSSENCTLHFSGVLSLLHSAISTSSVGSFTRHGSPFFRPEAS